MEIRPLEQTLSRVTEART